MPSYFIVASTIGLGIYIVLWFSYDLFNRILPSRREHPPISDFDLVPIVSDTKVTDACGNGLDIIFVHGLGSQPDTTWRAEKARPETAHSPGLWSLVSYVRGQAPIIEKQYVIWVQDYLPSDIADHGYDNIRMFYYNYDSAYYRDASEKRLKDLGNQLLSRITSETQRSAEDRKRQVIFVGHSYGGLVIKQALVQSKMSQDDREYSLAANTQGVIFLGTPHNGSTMSIWGLRLAKSLSFLGSNPALLAGLIPGCDLLKDLHQDFIKAVGDRLHIVNFFEEVKTRLFKRFWLQKDEYIVNQDSATFYIPGIINDSLRADHSGLNKFSSRDVNYRNILRRLIFLIGSPPKMPAVKDTREGNFELEFDPIKEVVNDFVGREDELKQIESYLHSEQGPGPRIAVLHGLGGIGKTQLASKYFNKVELLYSARFRVSGKDQSSFIDDFVKIADAAGLTQNPDDPVETTIKGVWRWLNTKKNDRWLIMLDNVDDPGTGPPAFNIDLFLKHTKQGRLIITTRLNNIISNGKYLPIEVRAFDEVHSLCIVENNARRPLSHENDCGTLLHALAGVPLALVQAGVFLCNTKCSVSAYMEAWTTAWDILSRRLGKPSNYEERTMSTTWQVSYERMLKRNQAAPNLLKFWAYLSNHDLEYDILQDSKASFEVPSRLAAMVAKRPIFLEAIGDLMENSFVTSTGRDKWSLHNVLHRWVCTSLNATMDEEFSRWAVVCVGSKAEKRGTSSYWDTSGRLGAHAMQCIDSLVVRRLDDFPPSSMEAWRNRLLGLSRLCIARGVKLEKAEEVLLFAVKGVGANVTTNGFSHPAIYSETSLRAMNTLGNMHHSRRSYSKAAKTYQNLILILQGLDWTTDSWLQDICENYAMVVPLDQLQEPTLEISKFAPKTKDVLRMMRRIRTANNLLEEKNLKEATVLFDALLAEIKPNPNDKRSIKIWKDGALCYAQREDYGRASEIFEELLLIAKRSIGGYRNSLTLDILNNFGVVCRRRGQLDKAEKLLSAAEEGLRSRKGMADGLYLNAAENLGNLLMDKGSHARAKRLFEICLMESARRSPRRTSNIQSQIYKIEKYEKQSIARQDTV